MLNSKHYTDQAGQCIPVIPALERWRPEDSVQGHPWAIKRQPGLHWNPISKNQNKTKNPALECTSFWVASQWGLLDPQTLQAVDNVLDEQSLTVRTYRWRHHTLSPNLEKSSRYDMEALPLWLDFSVGRYRVFINRTRLQAANCNNDLLGKVCPLAQ